MSNTIYHKFYRAAGSYLKNPTRLNIVLSKALSRVSAIDKPRNEISSLKDQILIFIRMVKAYIKKEYTLVPWKTITAITAGLVYFVTPLDLIPDFIPVTGFVDDFTVLLWVFNNFKKDIEDYLVWESSEKLSISDK